MSLLREIYLKSLDLAEAGHQVYLVEKKPSIGGIMAHLDKVYPDIECSI